MFIPQNDLADELARRALLAPCAISGSLSFLITCIHSGLFSDCRHTVSSKFFDTQVPSISTKELVLPCYACCVLSCLCCNRHSLLLSSYLFRIGRIENPSCSACSHLSQDTSHLILHCPASDSLSCSLFGDSLSFYNLWFLASGASWSSAMPPSLRRGRVTATRTTGRRHIIFGHDDVSEGLLLLIIVHCYSITFIQKLNKKHTQTHYTNNTNLF